MTNPRTHSRHIATTGLVVIFYVFACLVSSIGAGRELTATPAAALSSADPVPCDAWSRAVIGNTGPITFVNAQSLVDSYNSAQGSYGGSNVGVEAVVWAATSLINNGGTLDGKATTGSPLGLPVVPVAADAQNLPIGSRIPGSLNINDARGSITLAPGDYVASNINVNFPGEIKVSPAGQVRIWVTGSLNLGGDENLNGVPRNLAFLVTSSSTVNVNRQGALFGLIYAPAAPVNLNSAVFGSVVGSTVTLNSLSAVHTDLNATCNPSTTGGGSPPSVASRPPHTLPLPPQTQGCFKGTANGWVAIACAPPGGMGPFIADITSETAIETPNGASSTIPFQFGQIEATFTSFGTEVDGSGTANAFSFQANTNTFKGNNGDSDWVQFVIQPINGQSGLKIETWDVTTFDAQPKGSCNACTLKCGCTDYGINGAAAATPIPNRSGGFVQYDFATLAGSVYNDVNNNPVIGMVAQFSWFNTSNDPQNFRGLYAIVVPDQYGLAKGTNWNNISGAVLGFGGGSEANFDAAPGATKSTSILTRTLAGSCVNGTPPTNGIPWPGTCSGSAQLLPATQLGQVAPTAETSNLCAVGNDTPLVAANSNLVVSQNLTSSSCGPAACISNSSRIFVRTTDEDTGVRPINIGATPFWESPDLFVVPSGSPVDVNGVSTETLITPGDSFDVWVRVNNDFGCNAVNGAKALVYLADPSALSVTWEPITVDSTNNLEYQGGVNNAGVTVPAGSRALIGPFPFQAKSTNLGNGHKCILAAVKAMGEDGPANTTDPLSSFQVAQRNVQFSNCQLPLTNATLSNGSVVLTLTASGATPGLSDNNNLSVSFADPTGSFQSTWQGGPGSGTAYSVSAAGGQTTVRLGQTSVVLPAITIPGGQTVSASASISLDLGQPQTTLKVQATMTPASGPTVTNGVSCVATATSEPQ
jgi:hypothetical protein